MHEKLLAAVVGEWCLPLKSPAGERVMPFTLGGESYVARNCGFQSNPDLLKPNPNFSSPPKLFLSLTNPATPNVQE